MASKYPIKQVSVSRIIDAEPAAIFDVLADPSKHSIIDGYGSVKQVKGDPGRLALGSTFSMRMKIVFNYSIKNTVVEFEENRRIAWRHFGRHIWRYTLEPVPGGTEVTETFDWAPALSPGMIERQGYPTKHPLAMAKTLERLDTYVTTGEVPPAQP
ncbi:MAG: dimethyladenosine transferase [Actinobacteria bacterium]|nr:dimethyladenosine transferase [Actinomycetota bacterium]